MPVTPVILILILGSYSSHPIHHSHFLSSQLSSVIPFITVIPSDPCHPHLASQLSHLSEASHLSHPTLYHHHHFLMIVTEPYARGAVTITTNMENLLLNFTVQKRNFIKYKMARWILIRILTVTYKLYIDVLPNVLMLKVRRPSIYKVLVVQSKLLLSAGK